jgi:hypothetical protein
MAKVISSLLIAGLCSCASGKEVMTVNSSPVALVNRVSPDMLRVTILADRKISGDSDTIINLTRGGDNFDAYIDMVGGSIEVGQEKKVYSSIGRIDMLKDQSILITIYESLDRRVPQSEVKIPPSDSNYARIISKFPNLTPGHFRNITKKSILD